jgi:hypothetical protein
MEDTPSHNIEYKLAHRADKANFSSDCSAIAISPVITIAKSVKQPQIN